MSWWNEIEEWAERMEKKYGVDIEVFDVHKHGKVYDMKLGVWPWGATFVSGTFEEIEAFIRAVKERRIDPKRFYCPFCGTKYSLRDLDTEEEPFRCRCGSVLIKSYVKSATSGTVHDNNAFDEVLNRLSPFERETAELYVFEYGFYVEDVFENVKYVNVEGWPSYWIGGGKPKVKPQARIEEKRPVEFKLIRNGYSLERVSRRDFSAVWSDVQEHRIVVEYSYKGEPASIWIECSLPVSTERIWDLEERTGEYFWERFEEKLGQISSIFVWPDTIYGLDVSVEEFLKKPLPFLKKELQETFSQAFKSALEELEEKHGGKRL